MLSPVLVGPILRLKCMDAQCISNTTRVCLKAIEKHFFLLPEEVPLMPRMATEVPGRAEMGTEVPGTATELA